MHLIPTAAALLAALSTLVAGGPLAGALGMTEWTPGMLMLAGLLLLCVEVFVLPGFSIAGGLGLLAILGGFALMVTDAPMDAAMVLATFIASLTLIGLGVWSAASRVRAGHPLFGGILSRDEGYVASPARPELEGVEGVTLTDLRPAGTAEFAGERLDVVSEAGWIGAGTPVRVLRAEGYRHVVRAVPPPREQTPAG
jgi:membrane-bound serine protease (ClpP class)